MQAVILAAGRSSRFYPYSSYSHKSLIKIMGKTILEHTLRSIKKGGISDVILVISKNSPIPQILGSGKKIGIKISYVIQKEPLGMGDALLAARDLIKSDFFLLHAHHIDFHELKTEIDKKRTRANSIVLLAKPDKALARYGVLKIEGDRVLDLVEKPVMGEAPSNLKVIGVYFLTREFLKVLKKTPLSHYHFEKALSYSAKNFDVKVAVTEKETVTLKYPSDVLDFKNYLFRNLKRHISKQAHISEFAHIIGDVYIEDGVEISEGAFIKGPSYIGKNVFIGTNSLIRNGTSIEEDPKIGAYMEVRNSIFFEKSSTHSGFIGDSIIGSNCKIGAFFCTANVRLDRSNINLVVRENKVDTGLHSFGAILGNNVKIGAHSLTMPGVIVGDGAVIGPSTVVGKNISQETLYYTKFQDFVEEKLKEKKHEKIVLFDIDYTLFDTDLFKESNLEKFILYDEVLHTIDEIKKIAKIGIFSEGNIEFQRNKLIQTKIDLHFVDYTHIVESKEESIEKVFSQYKGGKQVYLVDDKLTVLYSVKKFFPELKTIWVKRGKFALGQKTIKNFSPDFTVENLKSIIPYISNG